MGKMLAKCAVLLEKMSIKPQKKINQIRLGFVCAIVNTLPDQSFLSHKVSLDPQAPLIFG